jgi:uncharacterized membrane protein
VEDVIIRVHGEEGIDQFNYRIDYSILRKICHRHPDRSIFIFGKQLPLCARCIGIYIAFLIGVVLLGLNPITFQNLTWYSAALITFLMIFPTAIDGFTQLLGLRESNNLLRLTTGMLAGFGFSFIFVYVFNLIF